MGERQRLNTWLLMKKIFLILLFLTEIAAYSQTISGVIKDKNSFLENASVIIENPNNGDILDYGYTDSNGKYALNTPKSGQYKITINALGYLLIEEILDSSLGNIQKNYTLQKDNAKEIKEVIITSSKAISIKKDTIEFNVKSFLQGNERVVEDLLKKIPGINVESDGTIKIGNREVEKVMIENDDFFEKGYKLTTKNMPVKPLDKIQILENYSNNKHLKNIEYSNKVALNLTLKEGEKSKWFGNTELTNTIFPENRYEAKLNLMNFSKKNKYFFLANANNFGYDATGNIENLNRVSSTEEIGIMSDDVSLKNIFDTNPTVAGLSLSKTNFNNDKLISLNSIHNLSKPFKIKLMGFYNYRKNNFYREAFTEYKLPNQNFRNTESFDLNKTSKNLFFKTETTYEINKNNSLEYLGNINHAENKNFSSSSLNSIKYLEEIFSNYTSINQRIKHSIKLSDSAVVVSSVNYIKEKLPNNYISNQYFFYGLFPNDDNASGYAQNLENNLNYWGIKSHYIKRYKNGKLLEAYFANQTRSENFKNSFYLKENGLTQNTPKDFNNDLNFKFSDTELMLKYLLKMKKIEIAPQFSTHFLVNTITTTQKKSNAYFYINPSLNFKWQLTDNQKIISLLQYSKTNLETLDLLPNYFFNGYRSFEKGVENSKLLGNSSASIMYNFGDWSDKFFANLLVSYTNYHDYLVSYNLINQEYSLNNKIIMKNKNDFATKLNLDFYILAIKSNLKLTGIYFFSNYFSGANSLSLVNIKVNNYNFGLELRSVWRKFNYHLGSKWNFNQIKSTTSSNVNNNVSFLDLNYNFNKKINFQLKGEKYYFGNLSSNNQNYFFADFNLLYQMNEKINFKFQMNNLLNTEYFIDNQISDFYISETKYRLLPRIISLGAEYSF